MIRSTPRDRPIIVLHTARDRRDSGNPYTIMLRESMPADVTALEFHWKVGLFGRYDVIHFHWPEWLIRDARPFGRTLKRILIAMLCLRLLAFRTPVVQTAHNLAPHETGSRYERKVLRFINTRTGTWITLNPTPVDLPGGRVMQITHGHYRDWFADYVKPEMVVGTLLFFGLIRPYKGVGSLIDAFLEMGDSNTSLRIVGASSDPEVEDRLGSLHESEPAVSAELEYVTEEQLAHELGRAELVVLPYRELYNSGAALLALSLGRPVLTPRNTSSEHLQREFGSEWVLLYEGDLSGADLRDALAFRRENGKNEMPDLSRREWAGIGTAHADLYRRLAGRLRDTRQVSTSAAVSATGHERVAP
jgi:beta-1,4-mannosyltransferase